MRCYWTALMAELVELLLYLPYLAPYEFFYVLTYEKNLTETKFRLKVEAIVKVDSYFDVRSKT